MNCTVAPPHPSDLVKPPPWRFKSHRLARGVLRVGFFSFGDAKLLIKQKDNVLEDQVSVR